MGARCSILFLPQRVWALSPSPWLLPPPAIVFEERVMMFDDVLGGIVAVIITGYLIYALIKPERF